MKAAKDTLKKEATEAVDPKVWMTGAVGMTAATIAEATRTKEAVAMAVRMGLTGVILVQEVMGADPSEMTKEAKGPSALETIRAARVATAEVKPAKVVIEVKPVRGATTVYETTIRGNSMIREMGVA
jgi:hypothetical protein